MSALSPPAGTARALAKRDWRTRGAGTDPSRPFDEDTQVPVIGHFSLGAARGDPASHVSGNYATLTLVLTSFSSSGVAGRPNR